jgi:8-oxo-dGTP pyrophosphatase MutT (NUDIX family)
MAHANFNVGIKAIMQNSEGKILALKAHNNGPMAGYNDMPGGRIDEDEVGTDFLEILKREIKEELGNIQYSITPSPVAATSWTWPNGQAMAFIYFLVKYQSGELEISDEHLAHSWIDATPEEVDKYFTTYHNTALKQFLN